MEKCMLLGVTVPFSRWCGVRACELRNSPLGLLSERVTFFSNCEGVCRAGVTAPNCRLHFSSLSGSAAALVMPTPVPTAPAIAMPCPSKARRLISPLPATDSSEGARPRELDLVMVRSSLRDGCAAVLLIGPMLRPREVVVQRPVAKNRDRHRCTGTAKTFPGAYTVRQHFRSSVTVPSTSTSE